MPQLAGGLGIDLGKVDLDNADQRAARDELVERVAGLRRVGPR